MIGTGHDEEGDVMTHTWPNGARCMVAFTVDFDGTGNERGHNFDPVGVRSAGGYSARRGVPRMMEIFERHGIPATLFVPGCPSRARVIDRLLAYMANFPGVHYTRMADLARWCLDPQNGHMDHAGWIGGRAAASGRRG